MVAVVVSVVLAVFLSGILWLSVGSLFRFEEDARTNDLLNLLAYAVLGVVPMALALLVIL